MKSLIVEKIKKVEIFQDLKENPGALNTIAEALCLKSFSKESKIITEGEEGHEMFIIYNGSVEIGKNTLAKEFYTVTHLKADQHAFFGEMAMLDSDRRSATVSALDDCELLVLSKKDFLEIGNRYPQFGLLITRRISQILASRLRRANQDVITLFEALVGEIEERV